MTKKPLFLLLLFLGSIQLLLAEKDTSQVQQLSEEEIFNIYQAFIDSVGQTLTFEKGAIELKDGLANLQVPEGFIYLNGYDSEMVLTDLWGNPPSEPGYKSLGMLFPDTINPLLNHNYAINITYSEDGYIDDSDAKDIDYDELLETMKEDTEAANAYRIEQGYPRIKLLGWASEPYYDSANKKLHWAKALNFGGDETNTLNYEIRILGRRGYLNLNVIGVIDDLEEIKAAIPAVLPTVNFLDGHQYSDFNPDIDKIAAYGIGGLIAGKVLLKAGLFAKIGILLAKFWKIIVFGGIALLAGARRLMGRNQ